MKKISSVILSVKEQKISQGAVNIGPAGTAWSFKSQVYQPLPPQDFRSVTSFPSLCSEFLLIAPICVSEPLQFNVMPVVC